MVIKILGSGCASCEKLEGLAKKAVEELGLDAQIVKVTDYPAIMAFGVMSTPALVVDEEVKVAGRVPAYEDVKKVLLAAGNR
ncbi:MAG: thioredoxin family protein [Coriobacteriia bacterium]